MTRTESHHINLSICIDCTMLLANGEMPHDNPDYEGISDEWDGYELVVGCGRTDEWHGEDCEPDAFSTLKCDTCNSRLAGARECAVAFTTLSDGAARRIASEWYSGPLYRFVSTGTIDPDVRDELANLPTNHATDEDKREVKELIAYVTLRDDRTAVDGWDSVWQDRTPSETETQ